SDVRRPADLDGERGFRDLSIWTAQLVSEIIGHADASQVLARHILVAAVCLDSQHAMIALHFQAVRLRHRIRLPVSSHIKDGRVRTQAVIGGHVAERLRDSSRRMMRVYKSEIDINRAGGFIPTHISDIQPVGARLKIPRRELDLVMMYAHHALQTCRARVENSGSFPLIDPHEMIKNAIAQRWFAREANLH